MPPATGNPACSSSASSRAAPFVSLTRVEAIHAVSRRARLAEAAGALGDATRWLRATWSTDPDSAAAGATDYLRMFGLVACGQTMAESALVATARVDAGDAAPLYRAKQATARFYAERILPQAAALLGPVTSGAATLGALDDDQS